MKVFDQYLMQMREAAAILQSDTSTFTADFKHGLQELAKSGLLDGDPVAFQAYWKNYQTDGQPREFLDMLNSNPSFVRAVEACAVLVKQRSERASGKLRDEDISPLRPSSFTQKDNVTQASRPDTAGTREEEFVQHPQERVEDDPTEEPAQGQFLVGTMAGSTGMHRYRLYVPSHYAEQPVPLIVMLHGCQQTPEDFAAGTGMNALAEEHNCLVVYPEQMASVTGLNCWKWFRPGDQQRDRGEPAIIAGITRQIMGNHCVDPDRVYIAGLSAGGAMAVVMAANYPELYAAIGVHSGLPYGMAQDVPSALALMSNGVLAHYNPSCDVLPGQRALKLPSPLPQHVPIIVFHGDRDTTVHPLNGVQALAQCLIPHQSYVASETRTGVQGRRYTRTLHRDAAGKVVGEHWLVHGAAHAWSGGYLAGSFADPKGPSASCEMLRFFFTHARGETVS